MEKKYEKDVGKLLLELKCYKNAGSKLEGGAMLATVDEHDVSQRHSRAVAHARHHSQGTIGSVSSFEKKGKQQYAERVKEYAEHLRKHIQPVVASQKMHGGSPQKLRGKAQQKTAAGSTHLNAMIDERTQNAAAVLREITKSSENTQNDLSSSFMHPSTLTHHEVCQN